MTFAQKMREMRDAAGLSEAKLADASGLPFATIHSYGMGRRKPSFAAVVKIASALNASCEAFSECDDIVNDEEAAPEPPRAKGRPRKPTAAEQGGTEQAKKKRGKGK